MKRSPALTALTRRLFTALVLCGGVLAVGLTIAQQPSSAQQAVQPARTATAVFAGGCFWCTEADFEKLPGVVAAESGYIAGKTPNPTYSAVSAGRTGHTEAVRVNYDPTKVTYPALLEYFWGTIDPTVKDRQFCDVGNQYRTGIYYQNDAERNAAEASKAAILKAGKIKNIETEIIQATQFYPAEEYHQDYYKKNPVRYKYYRSSCGRDARLEQVWGKKAG